ncbi:MAG: hypothetical protein RI897_1013 [Verrucomicrobiota bacterium]
MGEIGTYSPAVSIPPKPSDPDRSGTTNLPPAQQTTAPPNSTIVAPRLAAYSPRVLRLTRQEQTAIATVLLLLLVGWSTKTWLLASSSGDAQQHSSSYYP